MSGFFARSRICLSSSFEISTSSKSFFRLRMLFTSIYLLNMSSCFCLVFIGGFNRKISTMSILSPGARVFTRSSSIRSSICAAGAPPFTLSKSSWTSAFWISVNVLSSLIWTRAYFLHCSHLFGGLKSFPTTSLNSESHSWHLYIAIFTLCITSARLVTTHLNATSSLMSLELSCSIRASSDGRFSNLTWGSNLWPVATA